MADCGGGGWVAGWVMVWEPVVGAAVWVCCCGWEEPAWGPGGWDMVPVSEAGNQGGLGVVFVLVWA